MIFHFFIYYLKISTLCSKSTSTWSLKASLFQLYVLLPQVFFLLIIKLFISNKGKGVKGLKEDLLNNCKMNAAKPTELSFREFKFQLYSGLLRLVASVWLMKLVLVTHTILLLCAWCVHSICCPSLF